MSDIFSDRNGLGQDRFCIQKLHTLQYVPDFCQMLYRLLFAPCKESSIIEITFTIVKADSKVYMFVLCFIVEQSIINYPLTIILYSCFYISLLLPSLHCIH